VKRVVAGGVIALALVATSVTRSAPADPAADPAASSSEGVSPQVAETPLHVRSSKPLALEPAPPPLAMGWKLSAIAFAVGGVGLWLWKRRKASPFDAEIRELRILRRTPVGVRSELLLVDFEGQRLLLGVTPYTIQNLYIMPPEPPATGEDEAPPTFAGRLADVIDTSELAGPSTRSTTNPQPSRRAKRTANATHPTNDPVEGQARGLIATSEPK
jgi:flagellar biogenesis protein FliO